MISRLQQELKQIKPFGSVEQEALLAIARTAAILQHGVEQALKQQGITHTQYNVLRILRGAGEHGLCRHQIADRLIAPVPDVSRLLDRLVRGGLVTRARDKADRRLVASCITACGLALLARLEEPVKAVTAAQLGHIPKQDLEQLIRLLDAVRHPEGTGEVRSA